MPRRSTLANPPAFRGRPPKPKFFPPDLKRCQADVQAGSKRALSRPSTVTERCSERPAVIITRRAPSADDPAAGMSLCASCCDRYKKSRPGAYWFRAVGGESLLCPFCGHGTSGRDVVLDVLQLEPEEDWETTCPSCKERYGVDVEFAFNVRPLERPATP